MRPLTTRVVALLLLGFLLPFTSCKKDEALEEMVASSSIELNKETLLDELADPDVINFFDLNFIELANPQLSGEVISNELYGSVESVYLDFLIKNGELNYVPGLISQMGYPMWHRIEVTNYLGSEEEVLLIPFATENGTVTNSVMVAIPRDNDLFYQEHNVDRSGYFYLTMTRGELAAELENLQTATDNTYSFLFHYLYFDELIFDHRNEEWWTIWNDYEGLVSDEENSSNSFPATEVTFREVCEIIIVQCLPVAIVSDGDPPVNIAEEVQFRDCDGQWVETSYVWDCPGEGGGYIPGGGSTNGGGSGGGTTLGTAGGTGNGAASQLNGLISECSSITSTDVVVDNPQQDAGDCAALLAAIDNLGYNTLPPQIWLALFEEGGDLLQEAATVSPGIDTDSYILYLNYTLAGRTTQSLSVFQSNYRRVQNLQSRLELNEVTFQWLLDDAVVVNPDEISVAEEVATFLNNHDLEFESSATEAARIYLELKITDLEFSLFEEEFEAAPTWWFPFVKEIAKEAVLELIKRRVNGSIAGLPQNIIDAIDALTNGDILSVLGEALDIAKRSFPALQGIDAFFDGVELIGDGTRAWRAISKMRNFGDEVIQGVLHIVRQKTGGLLGKIKWRNNSTGAEIIGIPGNEASTFFEDLIDLFPDAVIGNPTHPNNILYDLESGVKIEFQPTSSTTQTPTVTLKVGSYAVKLRLTP